MMPIQKLQKYSDIMSVDIQKLMLSLHSEKRSFELLQNKVKHRI